MLDYTIRYWYDIRDTDGNLQYNMDPMSEDVQDDCAARRWADRYEEQHPTRKVDNIRRILTREVKR